MKMYRVTLDAKERQRMQAQFDAAVEVVPELPDAEEIARSANAALTHMDQLLASGSLEEKRLLVRTYVQGMKVDPVAKEIEVHWVPAIFSRIGIGDKVNFVFSSPCLRALRD